MFRFRKEDNGGNVTFNYEGSLEAKFDEIIGFKLQREVVEKLTVAWIDEYGDKLLKKLSPGLVEKAVKKELARRVLGDEAKK